MFGLFDPVQQHDSCVSSRFAAMRKHYGSNDAQYSPEYYDQSLASKSVLLASPMGNPGDTIDVSVRILASWPITGSTSGIATSSTFMGMVVGGYQRVRFTGPRAEFRIGNEYRVRATVMDFVSVRNDKAVADAIAQKRKQEGKPMSSATLTPFVPFTKLSSVTILTEEKLRVQDLIKRMSTDCK